MQASASKHRERAVWAVTIIVVLALELRMDGTVMVFSDFIDPYEDASSKHLGPYVTISPDTPGIDTSVCESNVMLRDHGATFEQHRDADAGCPALNLTHGQQERLVRRAAWRLTRIAQTY